MVETAGETAEGCCILFELKKFNLCKIFFCFLQSLKPSVHLFTQLSKVLKLSKVQEVRQLGTASSPTAERGNM